VPAKGVPAADADADADNVVVGVCNELTGKMPRKIRARTSKRQSSRVERLPWTVEVSAVAVFAVVGVASFCWLLLKLGCSY
jgi:hypothetical protein